jgi:hypothetical protein
VLLETPGIGAIPLDITRHHHERLDGSGYPDRLAGDAISPWRAWRPSWMFDAITADRCYHKGMPAAEALRKMWEWSTDHFDQKLLQAFMRCVGIYPVGSLVRLESGRLGVVIEQNEGSLLTPKLRVFFSTKSNGYIKPELLDLGRKLGNGGGDRIVSPRPRTSGASTPALPAGRLKAAPPGGRSGPWRRRASRVSMTALQSASSSSSASGRGLGGCPERRIGQLKLVGQGRVGVDEGIDGAASLGRPSWANRLAMVWVWDSMVRSSGLGFLLVLCGFGCTGPADRLAGCAGHPVY